MLCFVHYLADSAPLAVKIKILISDCKSHFVFQYDVSVTPTFSTSRKGVPGGRNGGGTNMSLI